MRLFVAVWPPPSVVDVMGEAVGTLSARHGADLRWVPPARWHVTLRFLGEAGIDDAVAAFRSIAVPASDPVEATVGPTTGSFGRRVLHVPVAGLAGLAAAVEAATGHVGRRPTGVPSPAT